MSQKIALTVGTAGALQLVSLDCYTSRPNLDLLYPVGIWIASDPLPTPPSLAFESVAAGVGNESNAQVILLGAADHQPYLCWQAYGNGVWAGASPLTGQTHPAGFAALATGLGNSGNLQVIGLGRDDGQPYLYWQAAGNGIWAGPGPLTSQYHAAGYSAVAAGTGNEGNLQVVALGRDDGQPYLYWQAAGNGIWSGPGPLTPRYHAAGYSALAAGSGNQGNLQVVALGRDDGQPYLYWQAAGNGIWTGPTPLTANPPPAGFTGLAMGTGNNGNLQVILLGRSDGRPYVYWQAQNGDWTGPMPLPVGANWPAFVEVAALAPPVKPGSSVLGDLQVVLRPASGNTPYLIFQDAAGNWQPYGGISHRTWMQDLGPAIAGTPLYRLKIPGTHDSGTYGIVASAPDSPDAPPFVAAIKSYLGVKSDAIAASVLAAISGPAGLIADIVGAVVGTDAISSAVDVIIAGWALAQGVTIGQQLRAGIRYLDIRLCKNSAGEIWVVHGKYSVPAFAVVKAVADFVAEHPQEIVILDFNHAYNMTAEDWTTFIGTLQALFGSRLASPQAYNPGSTVGEFWSGGATVIAIIDPNTSDSLPVSLGGCWPANRPAPMPPNPFNLRNHGMAPPPPTPPPLPNIQSTWPNVAELSGLQASLQSIQAQYATAQATAPVLTVLQGILTAGPVQIIAGITSADAPGNLYEQARQVDPAVVSWLPGMSSGLNIAIIDHIEICPQYVQTMIGLNTAS